MSNTFAVTYLLTLSDGETIEERIRQLQLEQSAELPDSVVASLGMDRVTGRVERHPDDTPVPALLSGMERSSDDTSVPATFSGMKRTDLQHLITIHWPLENIGGDLSQLLNILFGNVSMKHGVALLDIAWDQLAPSMPEKEALNRNTQSIDALNNDAPGKESFSREDPGEDTLGIDASGKESLSKEDPGEVRSREVEPGRETTKVENAGRTLPGGPSMGIDAIRRKWQIPDRALSSTALKPLGSRTEQLAERAYHFARGGIDLIKDDHGLFDQSVAPFRKRVEACLQAVDRASQETGYRSRYFPNITADGDDTLRRFEWAVRQGVDGVMLAPMLSGLPMMHKMARMETGIPIMAHPAFSGSFIARNTWPHGFEPSLFYGALWRAFGADFIIYPNTGGRFSFDATTCEAINREASRPDRPFVRSFPTPGGGVQLDKMPHWLERYGPDTVFLIGGSLYDKPQGIEAAARALTNQLTGAS